MGRMEFVRVSVAAIGLECRNSLSAVLEELGWIKVVICFKFGFGWLRNW